MASRALRTRAWAPLFAGALIALGVLLGSLATGASARAPIRTVRYGGSQARVPASWPVYRLSRHPAICVRLDRRAVYLGTPAPDQRCPAEAIGRRRAILLSPARSQPRASSSSAAPVRLASAGAFVGQGFDACSAPSSRTMSAWSSSPYRALGIYIGGVNSACSQPNLTASWVAAQVAAGWHFIPTYVGPQAPTSSCTSCAKLSSAKASSEGTQAGSEAVAEAESVAIGPGSPIYFDMEAYTRGSSATRATLTFLSAWTTRLHALGYLSGVYSSSASGIADLAAETEAGTGYAAPDDVWTADWNGEANTIDPYLSSSVWAHHQRIHQYRGAHDETYGGATINIDSDYVEGATAGTSTPPPAAPLPPLTVTGVTASGGTVSATIRCGLPPGEVCPGLMLLRYEAKVAPRGGTPSVIRTALGRRGFKLSGGRSHAFRLALNARSRPLLAQRTRVKAQLLVAIPGTRTTHAVELSRTP